MTAGGISDRAGLDITDEDRTINEIAANFIKDMTSLAQVGKHAVADWHVIPD